MSEIQNIKNDIESEAKKIEADAEGVVHKVEEDVKNVEGKVAPQVKSDAKEVKDDAESLVKEAEKDAADEAKNVEADVKEEGALAKDAVSHPTNAPGDAAKGIADAAKDVKTETANVTQDVRNEATEAGADAKRLESDVRAQVDQDLSGRPAAGTNAPQNQGTAEETDDPQAKAQEELAQKGEVDTSELNAAELADHHALVQTALNGSAHAPANQSTADGQAWANRVAPTAQPSQATQNPTDPKHQV